jgi:hypothetical protein
MVNALRLQDTVRLQMETSLPGPSGREGNFMQEDPLLGLFVLERQVKSE